MNVITDRDDAHSLMVLFLNLEYYQRVKFLAEVKMHYSHDNFMMTVSNEYFFHINKLITLGRNKGDDELYTGIYRFGMYDTKQRIQLESKYYLFVAYYLDNDGNDYFDQILLMLCKCKADLNVNVPASISTDGIPINWVI